MSAANECLSFLLFPGEIRNEIYNHVFSLHDHVDTLIDRVNNNPGIKGLPDGYVKGNNLALLLVCRQIYEEAHLIAFNRTTFITRAWGEPLVEWRISQALETARLGRHKLGLITSLTVPVPGSILFERASQFNRYTSSAHYDMFDLLCSGIGRVIRIARIPELGSVREFNIVYLAPHWALVEPYSAVDLPAMDSWSEKSIEQGVKRREHKLLRRMGDVTPCLKRKANPRVALPSGRTYLELALSWTHPDCEESMPWVDFTFVCVEQPRTSYIPEVNEQFSCETLDVRRR